MFLQFKSQVKEVLASALRANNMDAADLNLEESSHSDLASSVAFRLAPVYRKSPLQIAEIIASSIELDPSGMIDSVDTAGPYLNFHTGRLFLDRTISNIRERQTQYGSRSNRGKIILEHTSANPNGPLHVGHIRNSVIGDTLGRILKKAGYEVETQYYINDMGRQIAIVSWALEHFGFDAQKKSDHAIADIYIRANRVLEAEPEKTSEIDQLMQRIEQGDPVVAQNFRQAVDLAMEGIKQTLSRMDIHHDSFSSESTFVINSEVSTTIDRIKQTGRTLIDNGALMVDLSDYGFEKKLVIQRSDGTSLYTTRDLAYHLWKASKCDRMINVLGADHKLISGQLKAVLNALHETEPEIVIFEFVSLPEGSMSTRRGKFISADELLDQIESHALIEVNKRRPDTDLNFRQEVAKFVGIGAVRYDIVKVSPEKATVFDWREALDFEKQGAPFIQYSHARACSIMANAKEIGIDPAIIDYDINVLAEDQEIELVKQLSRFSAVIDTASNDLKPHHLATYAREVADSFNQFYRYVPVLGADEPLRSSRLVLVDCARTVLAIVLDTLGIHAPESM